jgi:hypothetical protein
MGRRASSYGGKNDANGIDQLLAIALIVRISELVKGTLKKEAAEILSRALVKRPDGFWTISDTKNVPLEGNGPRQPNTKYQTQAI